MQFLRTTILKIFWGKMPLAAPTGVSGTHFSKILYPPQLPSLSPLNIYWFDTLWFLVKIRTYHRSIWLVARVQGPIPPFPCIILFKLWLTIFKWSMCCGYMVRLHCCRNFQPLFLNFLNQPLTVIIIFDILSVNLTNSFSRKLISKWSHSLFTVIFF